MEIVNNTNNTWKIGDIVIDNDGRKGIIKKDKDNNFVIVRIDETHVGDYFNGLVYEAGINMYGLQRNAHEFHKVNDNNDNEEWQTGDVLKNKDTNDIGLILENDIHEYCLINITTNFIFINKYDNIADLQKDNREYWHKVNAKLVIE